LLDDKYEITEQPTADLFENLNYQVDDEQAVRFRTILLDEDKVPKDLTTSINSYKATHVPIEMTEMIKHLPIKMQASLNKLWACQQPQPEKHICQKTMPI
jgi:hypothetical protein